MRIHPRWSFLTLVVFGLLICPGANAASLVGKVIEVNDGDEITIFNLNRPLRIKLLAIDAPEKDQAFGAVAKQHLFDLVYDKVVSVEYSGIGHHSSLLGRVTVKDTDICAQMIRDGAAWFDPFNKNLLTESQREIYALSELAARSEKRGLWQSGDPVAPWEFVKAREVKKNMTTTTARIVASSDSPKQAKAVAELDSMALLRTGGNVAQPMSSLANTSFADGSIARTWKPFQFSGAAFSAVVPDGGLQEHKDYIGDGNPGSVSFYFVKERDSVYEVIWIKTPTRGESDTEVLEAGLRSDLRGANDYLERVGVNVECVPTGVRKLSLRDYKGREYDMTTCAVPHYLRLYTKMSNGERLIFGGLVVFKQEDDNVARFLRSFSLAAPPAEAQKD